MDSKPKNLQFMGVFGIIQEAIKLIYQWRKIFTQITLAFIIPSSILSFANLAISIFFLNKTKPSNNSIFSQSPIHYPIFNIVSSLASAVLLLVSTATVSYTIACVYAGHDVSFEHVIRILREVWKRVLLTYLSVSISLFGITFVYLLVLFLIVFSINGTINRLSFENHTMTIIVIIVMIIFFVGYLYLILTWQLSKTVAVLEELCGFKAMARSKALVKGKMTMVIKLFIVLGFPIGVVQLVFYGLLIQSTVGIVGKLVLIIIWMLLSTLFLLVSLVAQTVLYFVCKSYHQKLAVKLSISDHLQRNLVAHYDLLKAEDDVHTEKLQIV